MDKHCIYFYTYTLHLPLLLRGRMKNVMIHNGMIGTVEYNDKARLLYGQVQGAKPKIEYAGKTVAELRQAFESSVDKYIATSKQPRPNLTGSFNVRVGAELHKRAIQRASKDRISINKVVIAALEDYLD